MILSLGTLLAVRLRMSEKSSFAPADILDVVEADTPREVAAESTAEFTWDVLEQAERQSAMRARKSRVMRCMVFVLAFFGAKNH
jgi:hypothetical protein